MNLKDMVESVVFQHPNGLGPLEIVEELAKQYNIQTHSKEVLQILEKNPKLFEPIEGRFKMPSTKS
jgi:hypothetical protein